MTLLRDLASASMALSLTAMACTSSGGGGGSSGASTGGKPGTTCTASDQKKTSACYGETVVACGDDLKWAQSGECDADETCAEAYVGGKKVGACVEVGGGTTGAGIQDTAAPDAGGAPDTNVADASTPDTTVADTSVPDTTVADTSKPDVAPLDTSKPDTFVPPDVGPADLGPTDTGPDVPTGQTWTIAQLNQLPEGQSCAPDSKTFDLGKDITIAAVTVTTPVGFTSSKLDGFGVQSAGGQWKGLYVVVDKGTAPMLAPGDVVDLFGTPVEYYCLTEMHGTVTALGTTKTPTASPVTLADIGEFGTLNEAYEGQLVTVTNVTVSNGAPVGSDGKSHGQFTVGLNASDEALWIDHGFQTTFATSSAGVWSVKYAVGDKFSKITGILLYSFGHFTLVPRTDADLL